ncbi:MAG: NusG domain II-containing protein [Candidatus Muiribacteriota bacterium]
MFKKQDLILYLLLIILIFSVYIFSENSENISKKVIINYSGKTETYDISIEREIQIQNALVKIKNSKVSIVENCCQDKLCIKMGEIEKENDFILCIPENIIIKIEGEEKIDSYTW